MKKALFVCMLAGSLFSCRSLSSNGGPGSLQSVTYIDPSRCFALGEGTHGAYDAQITNQGKGDIVVSVLNENGETRVLDTLLSSQTGKYSVAANTQAFFQNTSPEHQGVIAIRLRGDTDLSMGYTENK